MHSGKLEAVEWFFCGGVLMFTDKTSIDKQLYHLIFDHRLHDLRHGCCQSYWVIIIWISRVTFSKIGVIKDISQIAANILEVLSHHVVGPP
jgi:hypothetical protein